MNIKSYWYWGLDLIKYAKQSYRTWKNYNEVREIAKELLKERMKPKIYNPEKYILVGYTTPKTTRMQQRERNDLNLPNRGGE